MAEHNATETLVAFVDAHDQPHPSTGHREPIMFIKWMGGGGLRHHGLAEDDVPDVDEALVEEMAARGMVSIDYGSSGTLLITPTAEGREMVKEHKRVTAEQPAGDFSGVLRAIEEQSRADSKLAWPAVRPVLRALRDYWEAEGFSPHGIRLTALFSVTPDEHDALAVATIRALVADDYLRATSDLAFDDPPIPAEVVFTDRARRVLDGWPGAEPRELVENLLAVLAREAQTEPDANRKRGLLRVAETVRELGVATAGDVLSKVITGGA